MDLRAQRDPLAVENDGGSYFPTALEDSSHHRLVHAARHVRADQTERTQDGTTFFTTGPLGLDSSTDAVVRTPYVRDSEGNLVSENVFAGDTYHYLFDGLRSVMALTQSSGAVVNRYSYDPYGNPIASATT